MLPASSVQTVHADLTPPGGNISFGDDCVELALPAPRGNTIFRLDSSWKVNESRSSLATPLMAAPQVAPEKFVAAMEDVHRRHLSSVTQAVNEAPDGVSRATRGVRRRLRGGPPLGR